MKRLTLLFLFAYMLLVVVLIFLPYYSVETYSSVKHTTSQLAAQQTPNAWVMRATFTLLGTTSIISGWKHVQKVPVLKLALLTFGISLSMTAVFSHTPINPLQPYDALQDQLHSIFASITGMSFTIFALLTSVFKPEKHQRIAPIAAGIIATILSILMFTVEAFAGIWQRFIFLGSFAWMIYEFNSKTLPAKHFGKAGNQ